MKPIERRLAPQILAILVAIGVLLPAVIGTSIIYRLEVKSMRADDPVAKREDALREVMHRRQEVLQRPESADAHYRLAILVNYPGYSEAEREFRAVIRLDPRRADAHDALSGIYGFQKHYAAAIAEAQIVVRLLPVARSYWGLGETLTLAERYNDAIAALNQAVAMAPDRPEMMSSLANTYYLSGNLPKARQSWYQMLDHWGGDAFWRHFAASWLQDTEQAAVGETRR